jgi:hypothetical protein
MRNIDVAATRLCHHWTTLATAQPARTISLSKTLLLTIFSIASVCGPSHTRVYA